MYRSLSDEYPVLSADRGNGLSGGCPYELMFGVVRRCFLLAETLKVPNDSGL